MFVRFGIFHFRSITIKQQFSQLNLCQKNLVISGHFPLQVTANLASKFEFA